MQHWRLAPSDTNAEYHMTLDLVRLTCMRNDPVVISSKRIAFNCRQCTYHAYWLKEEHDITPGIG